VTLTKKLWSKIQLFLVFGCRMLSAGNFLLLLIDYLFISARVSRWEWLTVRS